MEKKEAYKIVKNKFKILGYTGKGNVYYKILDDNYIVGVWIDHDPYSKGFFIEYGVLYLFDEDNLAFNGYVDWEDRFLFTEDSDDTLDKYQIRDIEFIEDGLTECFQYNERTSESLINQLETNIREKLALLNDKEYVLKFYQNNLDLLAMLPENNIKKLMNLYSYDRNEINRLRKQWGYDKFDF